MNGNIYDKTIATFQKRMAIVAQHFFVEPLVVPHLVSTLGCLKWQPPLSANQITISLNTNFLLMLKEYWRCPKIPYLNPKSPFQHGKKAMEWQWPMSNDQMGQEVHMLLHTFYVAQWLWLQLFLLLNDNGVKRPIFKDFFLLFATNAIGVTEVQDGFQGLTPKKCGVDLFKNKGSLFPPRSHSCDL